MPLNHSLSHRTPNKHFGQTSHLARRSELKKLLTESSLTCTFHCYPKIFQYKSIYAKVLWIGVFLIFSCLTFWLVIKCLLDYFEFDVVSKIRVYAEDSSAFPTITICDANPLTTKQAEHEINETIRYISDNTVTNSHFGLGSTFRMAKLSKDIFMGYVMSRSFLFEDSQKQALGFSLDNVLQMCSFNLGSCDSSNFTWYFSYTYGNCFQFNTGISTPMRDSTVSGRMYGLVLFMGPLTNLNAYDAYYSSGLRIFISNGSFLSTSTQEIFVKTGEHSSITIKKTFTHKAPWPYSKCVDLSDFHSDLYDYINASHSEYRQKDCLDLCLQRIIIEKCHCFMTLLPLYGNASLCMNESQIFCSYSYYNSDLRKQCTLECPLECDYATYDWTLSTLDYPTKQFYEETKATINTSFASDFEEVKRTHLALNIFYPSLEYTELSEVPKISFADLVSSMGGALGIFLGFSIFSLIEIFEILVKIFSICLVKK